MPILACPAGYLLHEHAHQFEGGGTGWLSLKSFHQGAALYAVEQRRFRVSDGRYLLLNDGQPYHLSIESSSLVESVCLFFAPGVVNSAYQSLTLAEEVLLDGPPALPPIHFFERTYPINGPLEAALTALRSHPPHDPMGLEGYFQRILTLLLKAHTQVCQEVAALPAARPATRAELYRRVHDARDYMEAFFYTPVTLDELAAVACLSPNHLLRSFRHVFGQSPHQFLMQRRLAEAQHLLRHTDRPITEICYAVGFSSLGSFSWWFHRVVGLSPRDFRQQTW